MTELLARRDDVMWRRIHDAVLLRPRHSETIRLAGTGPALWDALEHPCTIDELAAELAARFGVEGDQIAADLGDVVDDLVARGVLRWT